jgi:pimeloyl-ACP methyl ester carboxylesterase
MTAALLLPVSPAEERAHHDRAGLEIPDFVSPGHHNWVLEGLRLHCLDWGIAGRPPLLFLHGGGQTARTWDLACLALRSDYHCLALDQRGHGDSEWSYDFDYSPESHARNFVRLLDVLQIERAVVVGMSMGCINGLQLAIAHPDRVAAFVAVDAGPWVRWKEAVASGTSSRKRTAPRAWRPSWNAPGASTRAGTRPC